MFPDSDFAVPVGSFQAPVPRPQSDPTAGDLVYIGVNCEWLPYIAGALQQLLLQSTWQYDTTDELNKVQGQAFNLISLFNCVTAPTLTQVCGRLNGSEVTEEMPIRVDCDCNVFVTCCDGTEKQILTADQVRAAFAPQPGAGSELPTPGKCVQYHANMPGNGRWLLPGPVSTGDTLDVTGITGVTYDAGNLDWHCPGGDVFFAGFCSGVTFTNGANPMPSVPEMKLIASIGGTFYDVIGGLFTVPSGVSNEPVTFQVNHADISGDGGALSFDVTVCNNQASSWSHTFNLLSNDGGFTNIDYPLHNPTAAWSSGTGWEAIDCVHLFGSGVYTILAIQKALAASTVTGFSMTYDSVLGANPSGDTTRVSLRNGSGDNFIINGAPESGTNITDSWTGSIAGVTEILLFPIFAFADAGGTCDSTPSITLKSITISGTGTDPF